MKRNDLSYALKALKNGEVVVYPTDTLYALGADIYNDGAVKKIFEIKRRPYSCPFPVAVANFDEIDKISYTNDLVNKDIFAKKLKKDGGREVAAAVCLRIVPGSRPIRKSVGCPSFFHNALRIYNCLCSTCLPLEHH